MGKADVENAHIRTASNQVDKAADEAEQLLNDTAFNNAFDTIRNALIKELEQVQHDGSDELFDHEREVCRTLRTLYAVKRTLSLTMQGRELRQAGFRQLRTNEEH